MLKRKHVILAGAVAAVLPTLSHAATMTFTYQPTVTYWTNASESAGTGTAQISGNAVNVPVGDYFTIGVNVEVDNNVNPAGPNGSAPSNTYSQSGPATKKQPANLGVGLFSMAIGTSSKAVLTPIGGDGTANALQDSTTTVDPAFNAGSTPGWIKANGTVGENDGATPPFSPGTSNVSDPISGTINTPGANAATTTGRAAVSDGAGTPVSIFSGLLFHEVAAGGILTPIFDTNNTGVASYSSGGTTTSQAPVYGSRVLTPSELAASSFLAPLTVGTVESVAKIISLTAGSAGSVGGANFVGTYNPNAPTAGVVNVIGTGTGFLRGELNGIAAGAGSKTGQTGVKFENAAGTAVDPGTEYIGLNVADGANAQGSAQFNTDIQALINDINSAGFGFGATDAYATITTGTNDSLAGAPFGTQIAALGLNAGKVGAAQYDVVIGIPSVNGGNSLLGLDLTQDAALPAGLTVTDIGAVPEPASAAGLLIGASGLLLGRRKRKA